MSRAILFGLIPAMLVMSACSEAPPPAAPLTHSEFVAIRTQYQKARPDVRVGLVSEVLSSSHLALVGDVIAKDFAPGDVISFLDSNQKPVAIGTVETVDKASLIVKYDAPDKTGREPLAGDLAVRAYH